MTGTPKNTFQVPLYKICCLIPYQVNEQEVVNLSISEINKFLQVHGICDKFRVDSGRSSIATCTEDLSVLPETKKDAIINNDGTLKENNDIQIQYNWKNVNNSLCHNNEIVPWHKCSKNESVVHFCKKCNTNVCNLTNICSPENIKNGTPEGKHIFPDDESIGQITSSDTSNVKKISKKSGSDSKNKRVYCFSNRSFMKMLKKRNKNLPFSITKTKKEVDSMDQCTEMSYKTVDTKIALLPESVVCETSPEHSITGGLIDADQENIILDEVRRETTPIASANNTVKSSNSISKQGDYEEVLKEVTSPSEWSDSSSDQSCTLDCDREEQAGQVLDLSFYENPSKFVENMSECVIRKFIGEECDDSLLKMYEGKKIPKKYLGIDKDLSELYILKIMVKHETGTCLISHLTQRQKRQLAKRIVFTLDEFNINGSRWGGLSREILKNVCKLFKTQQGSVV